MTERTKLVRKEYGQPWGLVNVTRQADGSPSPGARRDVSGTSEPRHPCSLTISGQSRWQYRVNCAISVLKGNVTIVYLFILG